MTNISINIYNLHRTEEEVVKIETDNKEKKNKIKEFFTKNIKMKILTSYVIANLLYIFIDSYLMTIKIIQYKHMAKGFIPLLIANVVVGIIICIKKYYKRNITHLFILLIIIFGVISTIFAVKPKIALWGIGGRYEGLFTIMYYFSLMFLATFISKKYRKIIINFILICGAMQCIYAICQINEVERCIQNDPFEWKNQVYGGWF